VNAMNAEIATVAKSGLRAATGSALAAATGSAPYAAPDPPPLSIERPRLLQPMRRAPQDTVLALIAPAGYGKSTLLSQWARRERRPLAWLQLDRIDDERATLASSLAGALEHLRERARRDGEAALVLDDLDQVRSQESLALLAAFVRGLPSSLKLVLASRSDPPLALCRLHAAQRLLRLGPADLAMSAEEAARMLLAAGVCLEREAVVELTRRAEGWPAAIRLLAPPDGVQADGEGDLGVADARERELAEYVREEVLASLDADDRALLMRGAALGRLSGALCDAALDRRGAGLQLRELAAAGAMLRPTDATGTWFSFHPLVEQVLRAELASESSAQIPLLHARASEWLARAGQLQPAIDHAFAAGGAHRAGRLLWEHASQFLYGHDEQVQRWLASIPRDEIARTPALALAAAHSHLALEDLLLARHWARLAMQALRRGGALRRSARLSAAAELVEMACGCGGVEQVAARAERLYGQLEGDEAMRPLCCMLHGLALHLLGHSEAARRRLSQATAECARAMPLLQALSLTQLALIEIEEQDWEQAQERLRGVDLCLAEHRLDGRPAAALAHAASALVKSRRGLADDAKRELICATRLIALRGEPLPWLDAQAKILAARASARLADVASARALLAQASRCARRLEAPPRLLEWLDEAWGEVDECSVQALSGPGALTMAELRVLRFLPTHLSFREIGARLDVSSNTVKSQVHSIYAKLDATSRTEAVAHASALGLVDAVVV
jgi:LuxR family transcriptional regulator, maltose regulon positive regulatory protein